MSLGGLAFVQYRLLITGLALQKTNLDRHVRTVMQKVKLRLSTDSPITKNVALLTSDTPMLNLIERDSFTAKITEELNQYLLEYFSEKELKAIDFTFAVTTLQQKKIIFGTENFDTSSSKFSRYSQFLSGAVTEECNCQLVLQLNVENMFSYLLNRLRNLIIPSLLFLLLLIVCFFWLVYIVGKQRKLAEVKNDFINNLTHELKTPVFSVAIASKLLEEHLKELPSEKPREYLRLIRAENEKIKGHIDAVLELATLESGKYIMDKTEVKIDDFLEVISNNFRKKVEQKNGTLKTHFKIKNTSINIDETHFKNAIKNLLENALKYCDKEQPHISISTEIIDNHIFIKIKDNGKGISKEDQKHIFEKFFRVNTGNLHAVKGFGLGLSYAHQVIERHGGTILVESNLNIGSTFTIKTPLK